MKVEVLGLDELKRALRKLGNQMPEAIANGLNRTGLAVERREKVAMAKDLDRPTPFTLSGIGRWKAKPNKLNTVIYIKPIQAKYLRYTIEGGTLRSNLTPVIQNVYLDQHGNLKGKRQGLEAVARLIKAKQVADRYGRKRRGKGRQSGLPAGMFIGEVKGVEGLWQRDGRSLNLLVRKEKQAPRRKRWDFYNVGERVVRERMASDMRAAIASAINRVR